jgi:hypothetical protein
MAQLLVISGFAGARYGLKGDSLSSVVRILMIFQVIKQTLPKTDN